MTRSTSSTAAHAPITMKRRPVRGALLSAAAVLALIVGLLGGTAAVSDQVAADLPVGGTRSPLASRARVDLAGIPRQESP